MTGMLDETEARRLVERELGGTRVAPHSFFVGDLLAVLAQRLDEPVSLWRISGYCHDLDYFAVGDDWSQHGLITAKTLAGRLPGDALEAIAAHDHRTGRKPASRMAHMLRLADAVAIVDESLGRGGVISALDAGTSLVPEKPYLEVMIREIGAREGLDVATIAALLSQLPEQQIPGA